MWKHTTQAPHVGPETHYVVLWLGAAIAGVVGWNAWPYGAAGDDWMCALSFGAWLVCWQLVFRGWQGWDTDRAYARVRRRAQKNEKQHGDASFADLKECRKNGLTKPGGIFLGLLNRVPLFAHVEGSAVIFGGPGQGKTTSSVLQQLLRLDANSSALVMDLKLECWAVTHRFLERAGFEVKLVCPWFEEFTQDFRGRIDVHDDGLNPFLTINGPNVVDRVRMYASMLSGESLQVKDANTAFFKRGEQDVLIGFMLLQIHKTGSVTLPELRRTLFRPEDEIEAAIEEMEAAGDEAFKGVLREYGARLATAYISKNQWAGVFSGALNALNFVDDASPVSTSTSAEATTDPRKMKDRPCVYFIGIPADKLHSHEAWLGICVKSALDMIAADRRKKRVLAILDEAQQLPPSIGGSLLRSLALFRSSGIQLLLYYQFLAGAQRQIGESYRELLGADVVGLFGGTNDRATLDLFEYLLGQETVQAMGTNGQPGEMGQGELGMSFGLSALGRPLLRGSDIRMLPKGKALYLLPGMRPLLVDKQSYLDDPKLRRRASKNPYYT